MNGKEKCRALKEIRRQIAEKNDIPYAVSQCTHQGNCKGTCPKCEAELRYLERELALRKSLGKAVAVAGISLAAMSGLAACGSPGASAPETTSGPVSSQTLPETLPAAGLGTFPADGSETLPAGGSETLPAGEPAPQDEYMGELPEDLVMGEILPASYTIEGDISLQEEPDISGGDADSREVPSFVE